MKVSLAESIKYSVARVNVRAADVDGVTDCISALSTILATAHSESAPMLGDTSPLQIEYLQDEEDASMDAVLTMTRFNLVDEVD